MIPISAVIITYNEERNIARCLDSLAGVADEIVVLDSFSTDGTEAICVERGTRFLRHAFDGHIQQKNRAVSHAEHRWVLSLDADEALSPELRESILQIKKGPEADGYEMNRLTNYCGRWVRHSGWYPDRKLRLWDKSTGKWGGVNPHDKVESEPGAKIGWLKGDLLHYSYYTPEDHYRQIRYFSAIAARELHARSKRVGLLMTVLKTVAQWTKNFVLRLGFLDGKTGWDIARRSAFATWTKYRMLRDLNDGRE